MAHQEEYNEQKIFDCSDQIEKYNCRSCPSFQTDLMTSLTRHFRDGHSDQSSEEDVYNCLQCLFVTYSKYLIVRHGCLTDCAASNQDEKEDRLLYRTERPEAYFALRGEPATSFQRCKSTKPETMQWFKHNRRKTESESQKRAPHAKPIEVRWHECPHCSYRSKDIRNLKQHLTARHTKIEDIQWFRCEQCACQFKSKGNLQQHVTSRHTQPEDIRWFQCENCPSKFKRKSDLRKHVIARHTHPEDIRWLQCQHCRSKFKTKGELGKHVIARHTKPEDIRWFGCQHCSYRCKQSCDLTRHIKSRHTKVE